MIIWYSSGSPDGSRLRTPFGCRFRHQKPSQIRKTLNSGFWRKKWESALGTAANIGIQPANAADCAAPNCAMGAAGLSGFNQFLQHLHVHDLRYVDNITGADGNSKLLSSIVVPGTTWANLAMDSIRAPDYPHTKKGETLSAFSLITIQACTRPTGSS